MQIDIGSHRDHTETVYYLLLPFSVSYAILSMIVLLRDVYTVLRTLITWMLRLAAYLPDGPLF